MTGQKDKSNDVQYSYSASELFNLVLLLFLFGIVSGGFLVHVFSTQPAQNQFIDCVESYETIVEDCQVCTEGWGQCSRRSSEYAVDLFNEVKINKELRKNITENEIHIDFMNKFIEVQYDLIETYGYNSHLYRSSNHLYKNLACDCYYRLLKYEHVCYDDFPDNNECSWID